MIPSPPTPHFFIPIPPTQNMVLIFFFCLCDYIYILFIKYY